MSFLKFVLSSQISHHHRCRRAESHLTMTIDHDHDPLYPGRTGLGHRSGSGSRSRAVASLNHDATRDYHEMVLGDLD